MTYIVNGTVTISVTTIVEDAASEAEAKQIAQERTGTGFCHGCSSANLDNAWCADEIDGEVEITSVSRKGKR